MFILFNNPASPNGCLPIILPDTMKYFFLVIYFCLVNHFNPLSAQREVEKKQNFQEYLIEIHFRQLEDPDLNEAFIDQLISKVNASDLPFDEKFELRYYLTQLSFVEDIRGLPAATKKALENLLKFISQEKLDGILEPLTVQHFKKEYLPRLLRINESDIGNIFLNEDHEIIEELLKYDFKPNAKVGEIGGGDGLFGVYLKMVNEDISLSINEISLERLGEISNSLLLLPAEERKSIKMILGTEQSAKMEGLNLDAIIIRNTFHHFTDPESMLESIKNAIHPDGIIYLLEQFKEEDDSKNHCTLLKEREYFDNLFLKNGWELVEEIYLAKQRKHLQSYKLIKE